MSDIIAKDSAVLFDLLKLSINNDCEFSNSITADQWSNIYYIAKKQALIGIVFSAIERLPKELCPPRELLLKWAVQDEDIRLRNQLVDSTIEQLRSLWLEGGFRSVVLKGQGNALLYDKPQSRTPGDIDLWVEGDRRSIYKFISRYNDAKKIFYHHADFPHINNVHIEIHTTPSWMYNWFTNKQLQRFFLTEGAVQFNNKYPSLSFNRVYLLVHIYRHLFDEGIGLRQILDYYYVLSKGFTESERRETVATLKSLKMLKFASAIMYVMQIVFGLSDELCLVLPNDKRGEFLLNEILLAGNFGQYDSRINRKDGESSLSIFFRRIKRNLRFLKSYPSEVIWSPIFKIWHLFWRKRIIRLIDNYYSK